MLPRKLETWFAPLVAVIAPALLLPACGSGGGSGGAAPNGALTDPVVDLSGPPGRLSRRVDEANVDNGTSPPPSLAPIVTVTNHWFRLQFPFPVDRTSVLENSPLTAPFSFLNGNVTVTDPSGDHIPGMALVNGIDVFGANHATDAAFPHDVQGGVDLNLGPNVFLYVADLDRDLSTIAAFGFAAGPNNSKVEITDVANHQNAPPLDTIRVTLAAVNGQDFNAVWTFHLGSTADTRRPFVVRIDSETKSPTTPFDDSSAATNSSFLVEFSKPMVPRSVGKSAALNGTPYSANMPITPFIPPFPNSAITATVNTTIGTLFVPFDCNPVNANNLATYRLRPLVDLPGNISVDVVARAITVNSNPITLIGDSAIDLAGNHFDGPDVNPSDGTPDGTDVKRTFNVGPGAAFANVPVSPEVIYWLPTGQDGIGAIDLNGEGIGTNAPGANKTRRERAIEITKVWINGAGCEVNPGGANLTSGIGLYGHPGNLPTPTDMCTMAPMLQFAHNRYWYPFGTGSYVYGPAANAARGEPWEAPGDPGNPGTPLPGVNEGSSGFETLCRASDGDVILTGREFGRVGVINDMVVGEFLDNVYFDSVNIHTINYLHFSFFNGGVTSRGNTIADPPTPNPPPLRYWLGLPTIGVVIDQANPTSPPLLLEGDEVFCGFRYTVQGFQQIHSNENAINAPDQTIFPHFAVGPGGQSATQLFTFSSRQQIGNFLYVADASSHEVHAINSNTMRVISSISTPDPTGLAIAPDMSRLYVTNFAFDSVSVVGCDPYRSNFHQEIARLPVGNGPRAVCVEPDNEDVLVCNYAGNSVSVISTVSFTVRKTLDALMSGPYDIEATPRQIQPTSPNPNMPNQFGFACGIYFAYISNFVGNNVALYESGPDGPQGIGIDNIRGALPESDQDDVFIQPRGLCASPLPNPSGLLAGGCFVAHRDADGFGRVSHIQFTQQAIFGPLPVSAPPGFFIPPGFLDRVFEVTGTWGNTVSNRLVSTFPVDVALSDMSVAAYQNRPSGAPNQGCASVPPVVERTGRINSKNPIRLNTPTSFSAITPDRLYVSFEDTDSIQVLEAQGNGTILNTIAGGGGTFGVGGVRKLVSYWRQ